MTTPQKPGTPGPHEPLPRGPDPDTPDYEIDPGKHPNEVPAPPNEAPTGPVEPRTQG
jgi:hypothetical protein